MRTYEELFILRPDITEEEVTALVDPLKGIITNAGGTVEKSENWGVRRLAYRIEKRSEGFYVLIQFTSGPEVVRELERRLRVNDAVMKFITVRIDEKLKKIEKRRKQREKRAARRPAPAVVAPAAPAAAVGEPPAMPGAPTPGAPAPAAPAPAAPAAAPAPAEPKQ